LRGAPSLLGRAAPRLFDGGLLGRGLPLEPGGEVRGRARGALVLRDLRLDVALGGE
jgi:hypothetical protein